MDFCERFEPPAGNSIIIARWPPPAPPRSATASASTSRQQARPPGAWPRWRWRSSARPTARSSSTVHPESRLGPDPQMFADVQAGTLEFYLSGATLGGVAPVERPAAPALRLHHQPRGLRRARRRARRHDPRRACGKAGLHAFRHSPAERLPPHHHQRPGRSRPPPISPGSRSAARAARSPPISSRRSAPRPGMVPFSGMYDALKAKTIRRPKRPARRRAVAEALRGADLSEPDRRIGGRGSRCSPTAPPGTPCRPTSNGSSSATSKPSPSASAPISRRSTTPAKPRSPSAACIVNRADTDSIRGKLGDFYARWKAKFDPVDLARARSPRRRARLMSSDAFRLDGKVALVTGAGRGFGRGIALALAAAGAELILNSRSPGRARRGRGRDRGGGRQGAGRCPST